MKISEFNESNCVFAKDQPEYLALPAYKSKSGEVISCWKLSFVERLKVVFTGKIFVSLLTFNQPLQPQLLKTKFEPSLDNKKADKS